jgi:hypothetical protein
MRIAVCLLLAALALGACAKRDPPKVDKPKADPPMTARIVEPYRKHPMYAIIETPAESPYEEMLENALATSMVPDGMQQICSQWYPEFGRDVADAFVEWRDRNKAVLDEIRQRSTEVWTRRAGPDAAYVKMVYPHLRKNLVDNLMRMTDSRPVEEFKANCANYSKDVRDPKWNLEKRLREPLRVIRQRPPGAAHPPAGSSS